MALLELDDLGRPRLAWPEPLIAEAIHAIYDPSAQDEDTMTAARLHTRFLRALVDGETERAYPLRLELIACCAARHIAPETIAAADLAAFAELRALARSRFRNSPRLQDQFLDRLQAALGALTARPSPARTISATTAAPAFAPLAQRSRFARSSHRPALVLSD